MTQDALSEPVMNQIIEEKEPQVIMGEKYFRGPYDENEGVDLPNMCRPLTNDSPIGATTVEIFFSPTN